MSRRGRPPTFSYTPPEEGFVRLRGGKPLTPLEFAPGERERLIAEALAAGQVQRCPSGWAVGAAPTTPALGLKATTHQRAFIR